MASETRTGGRPATSAVIKGRAAISVGKPPSSPIPGWDWTALTDLARLESGHTPSKKRQDWWDGDIPWLGIRDATSNHGRVISDTIQHTNGDGIANSSARILPKDTVCLSRTASVGYVVVMGRPMATSQDFVNWVCDPELLDWRFLRWVLMAERESFLRFASGTTHQTIYFPEVKALHILLPPIDEQHRIAALLGAVDDGAAASERVSERLEVLLASVFRDQLGSSTDWSRGCLTDIARFVNGKNFTKDADGTGRPVLRIKELRGGVNESTIRSAVEPHADNLASFYDLLFAWSGTLGAHRWDGPDGLVNQHIFKVIPTGYPMWFVERWLQLHMRDFVAIARDKATTMGHIQRRHLTEAAITIPPSAALQELDALLGPIDALRSEHARTAARLRRILDELLPKLVGGRLRVAEDYLANAAPVTAG